MKIGILTVSDRASRGEYEDKSGPAIEAFLNRVLETNWERLYRVVEDGRRPVADAMTAMCDAGGAGLLLVTGGTGPGPRDQTPEAFYDVIDKEMPGFGELMRRASLEQVPTAILSRQSAGIRRKTLILLLPGRPAAIDVCLGAVFPAIPYCLELIGAGRVETRPEVLPSFRPA
jgi:molybdopterin adenylyltransferase